jgi:hypothetical protein
MKFRGSFWMVALMGLFLVAPAQAQSEEGNRSLSGLGFGVKGGFGISPDQAVIGAQYSLGQRVSVFRLVPNFDIGFGDNQTVVTFNFDFLARLQVEGSSVAFYGGGAPTLALADGTAGFGVTLVVGTQLPILKSNATNLEARIGLGKIPEFRALFTIIF